MVKVGQVTRATNEHAKPGRKGLLERTAIRVLPAHRMTTRKGRDDGRKNAQRRAGRAAIEQCRGKKKTYAQLVKRKRRSEETPSTGVARNEGNAVKRRGKMDGFSYYVCAHQIARLRQEKAVMLNHSKRWN
eukprot:5258460-Pleurochrysis_carterae.AAC.2